MTVESLSLLQEGDLGAALSKAKVAVRDAPGDVEARARLFQMFCLNGEWDRASAQLEALSTSGQAENPIWRQFTMLLRMEARRREIYATGEVPTIVGDPEDWMAAFGKAFSLHQQGDVAGGQALREQALADAPALPAVVGDRDVPWLMDGDARLGPMLEAMLPTEGDYVWIPFVRLGSFRIEKPSQLNHLIWAPAHFVWTDGKMLHGFVPVRYIGSETAGDPALALSRRTDWIDAGGEVYEGRGQKVLLSDEDDFPILDIREARFGG